MKTGPRTINGEYVEYMEPEIKLEVKKEIRPEIKVKIEQEPMMKKDEEEYLDIKPKC